MDLPEFDLQQLLRKYRKDNGDIDYKSFCDNIDSVFFEEDTAKDALEKHRSKGVSLFKYN